MSPIKSTLARKAVKATAKHTARGTASKLKRDPVRAMTLFSLGAVAGWIVGRSAAGAASVSTGS